MKNLGFVLLCIITICGQLLGQEKVSNIDNVEIQSNNHDSNNINGKIVEVGSKFYSAVADEYAIYYQEMVADAEIIRVPLDLVCSNFIPKYLEQIIIDSQENLYFFSEREVFSVNVITGETNNYQFEITSTIQVLYEIDNKLVAGGYYDTVDDGFLYSIEVQSLDKTQLYINNALSNRVEIINGKALVMNAYNDIERIDILSLETFDLTSVYDGEPVNYIISNTPDKRYFVDASRDLFVLDLNTNNLTNTCNVGVVSSINRIFETSKAWVIVNYVSQFNYSVQSISKTTCEIKDLPNITERLVFPRIIESGDEFSLADIVEYKLYTYHSIEGETTAVDYYRCIGLDVIDDLYYVVNAEFSDVGLSIINFDGSINSEFDKIPNVSYENNLFPRARYDEEKELFYFPYVKFFHEIQTYSITKSGALDFVNYSYINLNQGTTKDIEWLNFEGDYVGQVGRVILEQSGSTYTEINDIPYISQPLITADKVIGFIEIDGIYNLSIYERSTGVEEQYPFVDLEQSDINYPGLWSHNDRIYMYTTTNIELNLSAGTTTERADFRMYDFLFEDGDTDVFFARVDGKRGLYAFDGDQMIEYRSEEIGGLTVYEGYHDNNQLHNLIAISYYNSPNLFIGVNTVNNEVVFEMTVDGEFDDYKRDIDGNHIFLFVRDDHFREYVSSNGETIKHLTFENEEWSSSTRFEYFNIGQRLFYTLYFKSYVLHTNNEIVELPLLNRNYIIGAVFDEGNYFVWTRGYDELTFKPQLHIYKIALNLENGALIHALDIQNCQNRVRTELVANNANSNVLFTFSSNEHGDELWSFNMDDNSLNLVRDFDNLRTNGFGEVQFYKDDFVYFTARENGEEFQLWRFYIPTIISFTETEIDDKNLISAYPNPSSGLIQLSDGVSNYELYNLSGQLLEVHQGVQKSSLDISNYPAGMYMLKIRFEGEQVQVLKISKM